MKKLYATENKILIYLVKSMLEEQGISCLIKNDQPPLAGEIPPITAWPELWVMDDDHFAQAQEVLQHELNATHAQKAWRCAHCGEQSSGQFNICWKCGSSR